MNFDRLPIIFSIVTCHSQAFEDVLHSILEIWLGCYLEMWMIYLLYCVSQVKTTSPKKYCVRPNTGIVLPQSSAEVTGILAWQPLNGLTTWFLICWVLIKLPAEVIILTRCRMLNSSYFAILLCPLWLSCIFSSKSIDYWGGILVCGSVQNCLWFEELLTCIGSGGLVCGSHHASTTRSTSRYAMQRQVSCAECNSSSWLLTQRCLSRTGRNSKYESWWSCLSFICLEWSWGQSQYGS